MLIVHLFVSYAHINLCHFFSSSWCQGLAATSVCGCFWTFLFTFLKITHFFIWETDYKSHFDFILNPYCVNGL